MYIISGLEKAELKLEGMRMNEGGGEALIENLELQQYGTETEKPTAAFIVGGLD